MGKKNSSDRNYARGQKDGRKYGNFNPPNGVLRETFVKSAADANRAYRAGHRNAASQRGK